MEKGKSVHFTWVLSEMCKPDVPPKKGGREKRADTGKDRESEKKKICMERKAIFYLTASAH